MAGTGGGVDVLDAGDFPKDLFERAGDAIFDLLGGDARHADQDVDHGHLDLRLLFPGQHDHGEKTQQERRDDGERGEPGIGERGSEPAGEARRSHGGGGTGGVHGCSDAGETG